MPDSWEEARAKILKEPEPEDLKFWKRQYHRKDTPQQRIFDLLFGILAPIGCLLFDPFLFRNSTLELFAAPLLGNYVLWGYLGIAIGWCSIALTLFWDIRSWVLVGTLYGSTLFAWTLAIPLFPFAVIGMFLIIGLLGYLPFVVAFLCKRHAVRLEKRLILAEIKPTFSSQVFLVAAATFLLPMVLQWGVNTRASAAMDALCEGTDLEAEAAVSRLHFLRHFTSIEDLVYWYEDHASSPHSQRVALAYEELEGDSMESRLWILQD